MDPARRADDYHAATTYESTEMAEVTNVIQPNEFSSSYIDSSSTLSFDPSHQQVPYFPHNTEHVNFNYQSHYHQEGQNFWATYFNAQQQERSYGFDQPQYQDGQTDQ